METLEVVLNAFLHYDKATRLWGVQCSSLNENNPHRLSEYSAAAGGTAWEGLGGDWRKCVCVGGL